MHAPFEKLVLKTLYIQEVLFNFQSILTVEEWNKNFIGIQYVGLPLLLPEMVKQPFSSFEFSSLRALELVTNEETNSVSFSCRASNAFWLPQLQICQKMHPGNNKLVTHGRIQIFAMRWCILFDNPTTLSTLKDGAPFPQIKFRL